MAHAGETHDEVRRPRFSVAKFSPPDGPSAVVERPRLITRLDAGISAGLVLVVGSAGSGKTTLLRQWMLSRPLDKIGWLNVDEADASPSRFWQAVVHAVRSVQEEFGREALDLMSTNRPFDPDAIEALVDELATVDPPITLVVDDLHLADGECVDGLRRLIAKQATSLRLVIGSRSEPAIDLGRLRAEDRLIEVRDVDLLLDRDETRGLLARLGVSLDDATLDVLCHETEGWAAGVHLAGVALRATDDPTTFVRRLASSSDAISHYLSSRVLDSLAPEVVDFMLDTCVVDELTPDLAAELSSGSSVSLYDIKAAQLMLFRNSVHRDVYRYHHLLGQLLRLRLAAVDPERKRRLHLRAARWYEASGDLASAFQHLWRADRRTDAMHLLTRRVYDSFVADTLPEVAEIELNDDDILAAPEASIGIATTLCHLREIEQSNRLARRIERLAGDTLSDAARGEMACLRVLNTASVLDLESVIELGAVADEIASRCGLSGEGYDGSTAMVVRAHAWAGDWAAADAAARSVAFDDELTAASIEMCASVANLEVFRGHLSAAIDHARRQRELVDRTRMRLPAVASAGIAVLGLGLLERGATSSAAELLEGLDDEDTRLSARIIAEVALSRLSNARGDAEAAARHLGLARDRLRHLDRSSRAVAYVNAHAARQLLVIGEIESSAEVVDALPAGVARDLAEVRLLVAAGDCTAAEQTLARAAERADCIRSDLDVALATVQWRLAAGHSTEQAAEDVLAIAQQEGFLFALAEAGGRTLDVIRDRARQMVRTDYIDDVLRLRHHVPPRSQPRRRHEELSDREQLVLRYLATSMSYREIATELIISVNTLKSHVKHIFRKLDATSRDEALANGRNAGYL